MQEMTLEEAVKKWNETHKVPAKKTASIDVLAYKVAESDQGQIIDQDSFETVHFDLEVYRQRIYENSFISVIPSRRAELGYEIHIYHVLFCGPERGTCVNQISLNDCEEVGIEVKKGKTEKITAEKAIELINSRKYLIRIKNGNRYDPPAVAVFKLNK